MRHLSFPHLSQYFPSSLLGFIFSIALILALFSTLAHSAEMTLAWNPNPEPDIAGYKIYWGFESRNYISSADVGNQTHYTFSDPQTGQVYYVAISAYNDKGESGYSNEISFVSQLPDNTIYVSKDGTCGGKTMCLSTIQAAINAAGTGAVIKIAQGSYSGSITLSTSKSLTLQGGWDSSFSTQTSNTTFITAPSAPQGSLTLKMVTIKP